jgi:predicted hotdog family 3-hydroxylacyl-ACP dehydratase
MLDRSRILSLIPHQGRMCLLDRVESWSAEAIACSAVSHRDPANPLRRGGRLAAVCGIEYGLQAAAAHGALMDHAPQPAGYLVSLRGFWAAVPYLDEPAFEPHGLTASFSVQAAGRTLLRGRASIMIPGTL